MPWAGFKIHIPGMEWLLRQNGPGIGNYKLEGKVRGNLSHYRPGQAPRAPRL